MLSELELQKGIIAGSRRHLAKAITLIESKRPDDRERALKLLELVYSPGRSTRRIGISGSPGVGKSTFIESFGKIFLDNNSKVAVLTIDPSSPRTSGSILGDKTRMEELSRHPNCFIRPTPAGLSLGGVARHTREAILLCEAAGFDTILIETVGVGQSEHLVNTMVDVFMFLSLPHAGDQLQGIKRGILELSDIVVITKADGDLEIPARQALIDHEMALHYLQHDKERIKPQVFTCSSLHNRGLHEIYHSLLQRLLDLKVSGQLSKRRQSQAVNWYQSEIFEQVIDRIRSSSKIKHQMTVTEMELLTFKTTPPVAAANLLNNLFARVGL